MVLIGLRENSRLALTVVSLAHAILCAFQNKNLISNNTIITLWVCLPGSKMAVSNEEDDGVSPSLTDNPFSFKKFVSKRSTTGDQNLTRTIPATKKKETATPEDVLFPEVVGVGMPLIFFSVYIIVIIILL